MEWRRLRPLAGGIALIAALVPASAAHATTVDFPYTGAEQTWVVPAGVTSAIFDVWGAEGAPLSDSGAGSYGGFGGHATATIDVIPGETIRIYVGGAGVTNAANSPGGFNGGGDGGRTQILGIANGGGGATDIRIGGAGLADRVLVAGGGGGGGACASGGGFTTGGAGGGSTGNNGYTPPGCAADPFFAVAGQGGTQTVGGQGGPTGSSGTFGEGGDAATSGSNGGGGGGGWYGGGAGGGTSSLTGQSGGGGGGSGHGPAGTTFETGVRGGNGAATITYDVNDAPTDILLTNSSVAENAPQGTDVGNLSSTDPDLPAQSFAYSLVSGSGDTDNSDFQINGNTLEVKNPLNFEAGATRSVRIRSTDNGSPAQSFDKQFTITVTDVNEAATAVNDFATLNEDSAATTINVRANDSDPDATKDLITGKSNGLHGAVAITNGGADLTYTPATNHSGPDSFSYILSGGSSASVSVTVLSVNDAPTGSDKSITTDEDSTKTFSGSDFGFSDPNDSPPNGFAAIKVTTLPGAGALRLNGAAVSAGDTVNAADLAANKLTYAPASDACGSAYASFTFQVQDDGGTANGGADTDQSANTITIDVSCVNDTPTNISLTSNSVAENTAQGTDIGELSSTDHDLPAQSFTYSLVSGSGDTDNSDFQINGNTLEVKNPLDFEAGATRSVRIRTTDNGSPTQGFEKQFTITVTDANDAPTNISLTSNSVAENAPQGTDVGNLSSTDLDTPAQTFTYTLASGTGDADNLDFQITGSTLEVKNPLNFEAGATRSVRIRTTDSGSPAQSFEKQFTITVTDVDETPAVSDSDSDGVADATDNCPNDANPTQEDLDGDGVGDACDPTDDRPGPPAEPMTPETTIGSFPHNPKRAHTHFRFRSSVAGSSFTCQLDKEVPEPCRSPVNYRNLEPGRHRFKVFATSPQGVSDPTPAKARFRISD